VKRIMTGHQFSHVLRFLHVADVRNQPLKDADDYNPAYKVQEFMDSLESRFSACYTPSQNLSLDESLIRAFGCTKFKVRIITKLARYGIKLYVLTDALNAYVLKVIVYTGASTYYNSGPEDTKKTVMVVKQLVDKYKNTHCTIYVDQFYTSIDLLKALNKMNLYVTGTLMRNRLPKEVIINKSSKEYKEMGRGRFCQHLYQHKNHLDITIN
jgi:Transposase IS4